MFSHTDLMCTVNMPMRQAMSPHLGVDCVRQVFPPLTCVCEPEE